MPLLVAPPGVPLLALQLAVLASVTVVTVVTCAACGDAPHIHEDGDTGPFAVEVVSFEPGDGAGFGQDRMPDVVLGGPHGGQTAQGSTDVLSLGVGGVIVLRLGAPLTDGDGADLLVFENPFVVGAEGGVFGEPGEVSVSADGTDFVSFPCTPDAEPPNGCAGFGVVLAGIEVDVDATNPASAGGDAFDLADLADLADRGITEASFVRIVDRSTTGASPSAGFDLDAVASVHAPLAR